MSHCPNRLFDISIIMIKFLLSYFQRWSSRERPWPRGRPRGHLALASKLNSLALASKPTSPRKYAVLGSRTSLFLMGLKGK